MDLFFRISLAIIYFSQFLGIIFYNKNSNVENVAYDDKEPEYILFIRIPSVLFIVSIIIIYIIYPPIFDFVDLNLNHFIRIIGIILGIIADILLFWTLNSLGKNISTTLSVSKNHTLIISGPYKYVRHPMYSLGILLFISLMLISSNLIIGVPGIIFQLFLMIFRTPFEEKMLDNRFGKEYFNYKKKTGKFVPNII